MPAVFKGDYSEWLEGINKLFVRERPYQIIFDEYGDGLIFKKHVINMFKLEKGYDTNGIINFD